jgi:hypothetical protein
MTTKQEVNELIQGYNQSCRVIEEMCKTKYPILSIYQGSGYYLIHCPECGEPIYYLVSLSQDNPKFVKCWYCDKRVSKDDIEVIER